MLMFIIGMSLLFSYVMSYLHISQSAAQAIVAMHLSKWLLLAAILTLRVRSATASRRAAWAVLAALALQLCIGITMVLRGFPLQIATAHNAGAALLLLATLALYRSLRKN